MSSKNTGYYNSKRLALSILWIVIGAALCILTAAGILDSAMYSGMGAGFLAVGILLVARHIKYRTNEEYRKKVDVETDDERNHFIRMKAWSWTGYIFRIVTSAAAITMLATGREAVAEILSLCVCGQLIVFLVSYSVLRRKY